MTTQYLSNISLRLSIKGFESLGLQDVSLNLVSKNFGKNFRIISLSQFSLRDDHPESVNMKILNEEFVMKSVFKPLEKL